MLPALTGKENPDPNDVIVIGISRNCLKQTVTNITGKAFYQKQEQKF